MMKKIAVLASVLAVVFMATASFAQTGKTFAVLPVKYTGPKSFGYLIKGVELQLEKKLTWPGKYAPADAATEGVEIPKTKFEALHLADTLGVDAVVWCSINQMGNTSAVILEAVGKNGHQWKGDSQMNINELPLWLESATDNIQGEVYQRPGYGTRKKSMNEVLAAEQGKREAPNNSSIIAGSSADVVQPQVMTLNPNFRYEGGAQTPGRWRSQTLRYPSFNMVVGDADGDGKNEIFIVGKQYLYAYRYKDGKLDPLDKYEIINNDNTTHLRLSIIDLNGDKADELVLSSMSYERPDSTILSFKGGKFSVLKTGIRYYLATMNRPPLFRPTLVAQKRGRKGTFPKRIYEAVFDGSDIQLAGSVPTPAYANVFNMNYLPDQGSYNIVVLDDMQRPRVYDANLENLYMSEETYNSSVIGVDVSDIQYGMGRVSDNMEITDLLVIPFRMVPAAITNPNKYEMLMNKDITMAGRVFQKFTTYSQGEIHAMFWDGVGLSLAWKTRRIKGTVTDISYMDIDNDGQKELCVLLNLATASLGFGQRKTMVIAYDLNNQ